MEGPQLPFDADADRAAAQFAPVARQALCGDRRRIVVVGAGGWIGRTVLSLLSEVLSAEFNERVVCFGSERRMIAFGDQHTILQQPLAMLGDLVSTPTLLLHLAFLTKDKVGGMDAATYESRNLAISQAVLAALDQIGVDRLFVASSGAAAFADDAEAAPDLRLYGRLKRDDEDRFAAWAEAQSHVRRAAIGRIYAVSGPYINKPEAYALADFILSALNGQTIMVRAPLCVVRGYVAVRELLSVVFAVLLAKDGDAVQRFATGGTPLELGDVAALVASVIGGHAVRTPISQSGKNIYAGDPVAWAGLLDQHGIEHLPLDLQIAETAAYLNRLRGQVAA